MATIPKLALRPSGYKAGKVYSELPTDGSGDLDFARTTTATRINKNNLIENVGNNVPRLDYEDGGCPSLLLEPASTNLVTQSEAFGNSYWTKSGASIEGDASTVGSEEITNGDFASGDTDWSSLDAGSTFSIGSVLIPSTSSNRITQTNVTSADKTYKVEYTISDNIGTTTLRYFNGSAYVFIEDSVGTHTFYYTRIGTNDAWFFTASDGTSITINNVSVKEVQGFASPSVDSPLGAFKFVEDTSTSTHYIKAIDLFVSDSTDRVHSIYLKPINTRYIAIGPGTAFSNNNNTLIFDTQLGVWSLSNSTNAVGLDSSMDANGWWRIKIKSNSLSGAYDNFMVGTSNGGANYTDATFTGDGVSGFYIFGAQVEAQSSATSYIPTAGTVISRTADSASKTGISSLINSTEGVLYVETKGFSNERTGSGYISLRRDGDAAFINSLMIQHRSDGTLRIYANGSVTANIHFNEDIDFTQNHKIAVLYKLNGYKLFIDGVAKSLSGTPVQTVFSGLDNLSFSLVSSQNWQGAIKDTRVYKTALTDLEIEELSSWVSFNAMALNFNYTIQ